MEPLTRAKIRRALAGTPLIRRVVYLPVVSSTNDVARRMAADGAQEITLVVANEQTAGRGRLARTWWSPPDSCLLMSLLVHPALQPVQTLRLTMLAGLAAAEAIEQIANVPTQLKWPNDIWTRGKKAGGVLIETALTGDHIEYAIVGIGLNINVNFAGHPELENTATSLLMETGQPVDRLLVLRVLVERFASWYADITSPQLGKAWARRLITLGQRVSAQDDTHPLNGLAEAVDDEGALLIRTDDGRLHRLLAGDVTLR